MATGKYCVGTPSILLKDQCREGKKILVFVIKKCVTFFQNNLNTAI